MHVFKLCKFRYEFQRETPVRVETQKNIPPPAVYHPLLLCIIFRRVKLALKQSRRKSNYNIHLARVASLILARAAFHQIFVNIPQMKIFPAGAQLQRH